MYICMRTARIAPTKHTMENIISEIREELTQCGDASTRAAGERFFKEAVRFYGVKNAVVHDIAKAYYKTMVGKSKQEVFDLCETLWQSGFVEEGHIACDWAYALRKQYKPADFEVFERWVGQYVNNWANCDALCNHSIGTFIQMYPAYTAELKKWAHSDNRWMRRAAAVSLVVPAKKGHFWTEVVQIAELLLTDQDDLVQKGYGWMLKEASKPHPESVFEFVMQHKAVMPRTALRYAIEKLPDDLRKMAMEK